MAFPHSNSLFCVLDYKCLARRKANWSAVRTDFRNCAIVSLVGFNVTPALPSGCVRA